MQNTNTITVESFKVGDGAHYYFNGDSYPATVRRISPSGKTIWVSGDDYHATETEKARVAAYGVHEGAIDSVFVPQDVPASQWRAFRLRKDGRFTDGTFSLYPGREYARNPHF